VIAHMRTVLFLIVFTTACWADSTFGTWKMDANRSTFAGSTQPKSFIVRIEPHAKGEVFTLDRIESDGRATSSSTILYFDGAPRDFQDFGCLGTQSSRRLDSYTVEILRTCAGRDWIWLLRRSAVQANQMILDIRDERDGPHLQGHVELQKQQVKTQ
jgi:hypothetical protein